MTNSQTKKSHPNLEKLKKNSYILNEMVRKNFKSQYRNSLLGVFWTVLHPLLNMIVLSFVFSSIFNFENELGCYPIYLFCGNLLFTMLSQITSNSLTCIVGNSDLIKKVKISYSVFPISTMFTALVNFSVSFIALVFIMIVLKQPFYWTMVLTLAIIPALLIFSLGIGYILASLYVYFRDVKHLYDVFLTLWMYLTPMFYGVKQIKSTFAVNVVTINPMTNFVTMFRDIIQWGNVPSLNSFLVGYGWAFAMLIIGYLIFRFSRKKFILYI